jgi:hypothetical protein
MSLHKITEFYTEWFSICPNITSKFHTIAIFKSFVKENDSYKPCSYVHDLSLYQTSRGQMQLCMSCLHKTKREF